tara:strand:- start:122 stop:421 length:300 start_codon:yes stop_codon:yes gene_type:complete
MKIKTNKREKMTYIWYLAFCKIVNDKKIHFKQPKVCKISLDNFIKKYNSSWGFHSGVFKTKKEALNHIKIYKDYYEQDLKERAIYQKKLIAEMEMEKLN